MKPQFTARQGQFLGFIHHYTTLHGRPPAEADMQGFFNLTPPSVHQMVLTLERRGLISRVPGQARSITLRVPVDSLSPLFSSQDRTQMSRSTVIEALPVQAPDWLRLGQAQIENLFAYNWAQPLDDSEFLPLLDVLIESFGRAGADADVLRQLRRCVAEVYHRYCQKSVPENTPAESLELMLSFLPDSRRHGWTL